jgi:tetratricopeptide (TPR) repeat protein
MSQYYGNQTSDLSASMTLSSIASDVQEISSVVKSATPEVSLSGDNPELIELGEVDQHLVNILSTLFGKVSYEAVLEIADELLLKHPRSIFLNNIIAEASAIIDKTHAAIHHYKVVIDENSKLPNAHNNIAVAYKNIGLLDRAEDHLKTAIRLKPDFAQAYNNFGTVATDQADLVTAQKHFLKSIELDPNKASAYWNLHSTTKDLDVAKAIVEMCVEKDANYEPAVYTLAAINAYKGDRQFFDWLMSTDVASDPVLRSIEWILSLPKLPNLHFNRWSLFDAAIEMSDRTRPFYEYGVWMGESFKYLIKAYKKGYGFDTFTGLPEDWNTVPQGTYSSYGNIPKIEGGEFVVGEFSESLPRFFAKKRPMASLINFDADLYSSTLCALNHSLPVIDEKSILIFDELIVNHQWENDEYKALVEFCANHKFDFEVQMVSLFTKQVGLTLKSSS